MKLTTTRGQLILHIITGVLLLSMFLMPLILWNTLPEEVAIHFNSSGDPDRWAGRGSLFILPGIAVGVCLLVAAIVQWVKPDNWNLPFAVPQSRKPMVYHAVKTVMLVVNAELALILAALHLSVVLGKSGAWITVPGSVSFIAVILTLILGLVWAARKRYVS